MTTQNTKSAQLIRATSSLNSDDPHQTSKSYRPCLWLPWQIEVLAVNNYKLIHGLAKMLRSARKWQ